MEDNVATALTQIPPGVFRLLGENAEGRHREMRAEEEIPFGHKVALVDIPEGSMVIKYGVPIGRATTDIRQGQWVHLHCMRSNFDERSSHLDVHTGAPRDTVYEG